MRYLSIVGLCLVLWLTLVACQLSTVNAGPHLESGITPTATTSTYLPLVSASQNTAAPSPVAITQNLSQTTIAPSLVVTAWLTYTDTQGVAFEYPAAWSKATIPYTIFFHAPAHSGLTNTISVEIYKRPLADRKIADPYSAVPNEGGYQVYWGTPLAAQNAEGLLYVWATYASLADHTAALHAIYYSPQYELEVRFNDVDFDDESAEMAKKLGLDHAVAEHFPVFDHMVKSIRFFAPLAPGQ